MGTNFAGTKNKSVLVGARVGVRELAFCGMKVREVSSFEGPMNRSAIVRAAVSFMATKLGMPSSFSEEQAEAWLNEWASVERKGESEGALLGRLTSLEVQNNAEEIVEEAKKVLAQLRAGKTE